MKNAGEVIKKNQLDRNLLVHSKILESFNLSREFFLKKYYCDRETLFQICLPYIKSPNRNEEINKFICLYLFHIKKFILLLKNPNFDKFYKDLNYIAENLIYAKYNKNQLIMKYGDKSDNFYITLSGTVTIIIPIKITPTLNLNEFSRYYALLLLYQEFEIIRLLLKENKSELFIDLPEIKFVYKYLNKYKKRKINISKKSSFKLSQKSLRSFCNNFDEDDSIIEEEKEKNIFNKIEKFMMNYLTLEEYKKFIKMRNNIDFDEKNNEIIEPEKYTKRIKNYKMEDIKDINLIKRLLRFEKAPNNRNKKKHQVIIYEYREITKLETGSTFGEVTMSGGASKRTATIITISECHFGCLNKKVFTIVKVNSEKKRKEKINFLCNVQLFKTISVKTMTERYLNLFAFKESILNEYIIKRGELNENIIMIKSGTFEINFNGKINDIFYLINYYKDNYNSNFTKNDFRKIKFDENLLKKIYKLNVNKNKIISLFSSEGSNKGYNNNLHKLFVINNLAIFGIKETEQKNIKNNKKENEIEEYYSFLDIKCTSIEGEYALLDKKFFYKQIYGTDFKIKEETNNFAKKFAENTIKRLINVLYCKMWNLLTKNDMKIYKYIKMANVQEEEQKEGNDLIFDVGLELDLIKENKLSKIEYVIDKILCKYDENSFDFKYQNLDIFKYKENETMKNPEKNKLKLEEEKCYKKNIISLINNLHLKHKNKNHIRLNKFRYIIEGEKSKLSFFKKINNNNKLNLSHEYITNYFNNNDSHININENISNISINYNKRSPMSPRSLIKNNISTPKTAKIKLRRSSSTYFQSDRMQKRIKFLNSRASDLFRRNSSFTPTQYSSRKRNDLKKIFKKTNSSYATIHNAQISKIDLSFVRNESTSEQDLFLSNRYKTNKKRGNIFISIKKKIEKGNGIKGISNSAKNSKNLKKSFFEPMNISKDSYIYKRKVYVLKNTRNFFTRYKSLVLSKKVKKMVDKIV